MAEDQRLLQRLHRGDLNALRSVYEKYKDDLLTIAMSCLCDIHAAEDCLHDVFVRFAEKAPGFTIRRSLKGYLITCIVNRARNQLRKNRNPMTCQIKESDHPTTSSDPAGESIRKEESIQVFEALATLSDHQHQVVVLHLYGEMKFKEIADLLKISIGTVQSRYRYGIDKLRRLL